MTETNSEHTGQCEDCKTWDKPDSFCKDYRDDVPCYYFEVKDDAERPIKLFVYGILKTGENPPCFVRGEIYSLGGFPGAIKIGTAETWVKGELRFITKGELLRFDIIEGVKHGHYRRVETTVYKEDKKSILAMAWIYEYCNEKRLVGRRCCDEEWTRGI